MYFLNFARVMTGNCTHAPDNVITLAKRRNLIFRNGGISGILPLLVVSLTFTLEDWQRSTKIWQNKIQKGCPPELNWYDRKLDTTFTWERSSTPREFSLQTRVCEQISWHRDRGPGPGLWCVMPGWASSKSSPTRKHQFEARRKSRSACERWEGSRSYKC